MVRVLRLLIERVGWRGSIRGESVYWRNGWCNVCVGRQVGPKVRGIKSFGMLSPSPSLILIFLRADRMISRTEGSQ